MLAAALAAAATLWAARPVAAQISVVGTWRVSETAVDVAVETWAAECGPRPTSMRAKGGGVVTIEQRDQSLVLHGRDQDIRSDACWSRNPAIKRSLASYANGQWTTRCRTPENEQLAEQGTYTLRLQDPNTLLYKDVSHYDWTLPEVKCIATYTTSQTFTRVDSRIDANDLVSASPRGGKTTAEAASSAAARGKASNATATGPATTASSSSAATPTSAAATATSTTGASACIPGPATRLVIRPRRAELEPGQRACFRVRLFDAEDCPVPAASDVIWQIGHGNAGAQRGTLNGSCFTAAETVADAAEEVRIVGKRGNLSAEVSVTVRHADLSSLIARRSEEQAADDDDDDDAFVAPKPATHIATRVAVPAEQGNRVRLALGIGLGACALLLVALGLWIRNNPRMRGQVLGTPLLATASATKTSALQPVDREPSKPVRVETSGSVSSKPEADDTSMQQWICPTCRVGYPAQQTTCPKDGSTLVSYATFTERSKRVEQEHAKRCPTCGKTYPASASFCGEDGVGLVSIQ